MLLGSWTTLDAPRRVKMKTKQPHNTDESLRFALCFVENENRMNFFGVVWKNALMIHFLLFFDDPGGASDADADDDLLFDLDSTLATSLASSWSF